MMDACCVYLMWTVVLHLHLLLLLLLQVAQEYPEFAIQSMTLLEAGARWVYTPETVDINYLEHRNQLFLTLLSLKAHY
jgi:hypothetical protein